MIKVLGTLKGVSVKSKLDSRDDAVHTVSMTFELHAGIDQMQNITESLKQIMSITLENRQPTLEMGAEESAVRSNTE